MPTRTAARSITLPQTFSEHEQPTTPVSYKKKIQQREKKRANVLVGRQREGLLIFVITAVETNFWIITVLTILSAGRLNWIMCFILTVLSI